MTTHTQEEIIEGNRLIADYCMVKRLNDGLYSMVLTGTIAFINDPKWLNASELKFHLSWDWLMPVVEKIEAPSNFPDMSIKEGVDVIIYCGNCTINYSDEDREYNHTHPEGQESRIIAVWKSCIEFITWYNEQTK